MRTRGVWRFTWEDITEAEMQDLQFYTDLDYFRFYPNGDHPSLYYRVFCPAGSGWNVRPERGVTYTVDMVLIEYLAAVSSSSSSSSSSH